MTGSIEKRGKDSYRLVVFKGYDLDGKAIRHQKTIHCKNKSEARTELAKYIAEIENGFVVEGNVPTFKEFVEIWKRDYGLKELAPSTYYRYLGILESRILPYFGHFKLNKIRPIDIMQFYNLLDEDTQIIRKKNNNGKKTRKPLSKKTILEHHRLLHAMLTKAVYWQMIVNNPAERVQPPKAPKPKRECYDEVQTRILIDNLEKLTGNDIKYKVAVLLDIFIGARLGELAGLEWSDIDLKSGIISINKSSQYLSDKGIFTKSPKTESSIREVAIPDFIVSLLEEYKLWYEEQKSIVGDFWHDSDRLFVQVDGKPITPSTISKWFEKFIKQIGLPVITFHGLRHTNATLLIAQQVDVATVSARLGHAQITTTYNFYVHPLKSHDKHAGNVLENLLVTNTH